MVRRRPFDTGTLLGIGMILANAAGYAWFVHSYTDANGNTDTVKATYLVQIMPIVGILFGQAVGRFGRRHGAWPAAVLLVLLGTAGFTADAWFSAVAPHGG